MNPSLEPFFILFSSIGRPITFTQEMGESLLVFADLCNDLGEEELEIAARWMAKYQKWPAYIGVAGLHPQWGFGEELPPWCPGEIHNIPGGMITAYTTNMSFHKRMRILGQTLIAKGDPYVL